MAVGCHLTRFPWCAGLHQVNVWVFFVSYALIIGLAFPLMQITLNTLFSKVLGPRRQGTEQGLLQVSSGLGRMAGPLGATELYTGFGPRPVWAMEVLVIGSVFAAWLLFYRRMVPLRLPAGKQKPCSVAVVSPTSAAR